MYKTTNHDKPHDHFACLLLGLTLSGGTLAQTQSSNPSNTTTMEKKLIGNTLALYPMPLTVVGAEVEGRVNWLVVAHVGIIGHDRILVSMSQSHYTNRGSAPRANSRSISSAARCCLRPTMWGV